LRSSHNKVKIIRNGFKFTHENAPAEASRGGVMTDSPQSQAAASTTLVKRLWIHGFLVGLALVILGLAGWYFLSGTLLSTPSGEIEPGQAAQLKADQAPAAAPLPSAVRPENPATVLKGQLEQVLIGLREANQKKDLSLLLSYYSPNFPQLTQRAQAISKTWKSYDYSQIEFEINELEVKNTDTAVARVNWKAAARNIDTKSVKTISKTYRVTFVREAGQWHIKALEGSPHQTG
jgi:hypothetical protein